MPGEGCGLVGVCPEPPHGSRAPAAGTGPARNGHVADSRPKCIFRPQSRDWHELEIRTRLSRFFYWELRSSLASVCASSHQLFKKKMAPTGSQMTEWERLHADGARAADPVAGSSRAVSAQVARRAGRRRVTGPGLAGDTPDLLSNLFQTSEPHQTLSLTSSRLGPWLPSVIR